MGAEIVRTARTMFRRGLVAGTQGNVSARVDGGFVVTPTAHPYEAMAVEDLVALAPDGAVLDGRRAASREWRVHAAIYRRRPDVEAIVHTHSLRATAWSHRGEPLGPIPIAPFAVEGSVALAEHADGALGDRDAVLLANHGVVGVGVSLDDALAVCERVEWLAERSTQ